MECSEQSSAQVPSLPAKEDAARYELQLDILDSLGSDQYHVVTIIKYCQ
jgi:hypothetical protein